MRGTHFLALSLACGLVAFAAPDAARADPRLGPPLGTTKYAAVVDGPDGEPDVDEYVVELFSGETMTLSVASASGSALLPELSLVRPDGTELVRPALAVIERSGGKQLSLPAFVADQSGTWLIRVGGRDGTEGAYSLSTKFKSPKSKTLKGTLTDATAFGGTYDFAGIEGSTVDVTLSWKQRKAVVDFTSFTAPDGSELPGTSGALFDESSLKKTTRTFRGIVLPGPEGNHRLAFRSDVPATFTLKVVVRPPRRPVVKKPIVLASEPWIAPVAAPVRSDAGRRVTIAGAGFVSGASVFFGDAAGSNVSVATDGTSIDADVPAGPRTTVVSLTVQNPDQQAVHRAGWLLYVPLPEITDLTDAGGAAARIGPAAGGRTLRLVGANFENGYGVRFGGDAVTVVDVPDGNSMTVRTPAHAAGDVAVTVTDDLGRTVTAPFQYTYKSPPTFGASPYSPSSGAPAGGTEITVTGTGFESDDVLRIAGAEVAKTHVSATSFRFSSPQKTPGFHSVTITDRAGSEVAGPDFEVKAPPAFAASPYSPAAGTTAGGTVVTVSGTGFAADDVLTIDGSAVSATFVSPTSFRFASPAKSSGSYTLTLTDRFGAVVSGPAFPVKAPPTFAASPYSPPGGTTSGGTIVTLSGTVFEDDDILRIDGNAVAKTFDSATQARFASPAKTPGKYAVTLTDRTGTSVQGPEFEVKAPPAFAATPYSPAVGPLAGGAVVTVTGTGFSDDDVLRFDGAVLSKTFLSSTSFRFTSPAKAEGKYAVTLTDRLGGAVSGPEFQVKGAPTITSVALVAGPSVGTKGVPLAGGTTARVTGTGFVAGDTVTLGGTAAATSNVTSTQFDFTVPSSDTPGDVALAVTDAFNQGASLAAALRYVGYVDASSTRAPSVGTTDDFTALRGQIGDLDVDGSADDVAIVAEYAYYGSRTELTRVLVGDGTKLVDATSSSIPSAYSDALGVDDWRASAVALGDLDGDKDTDIAIAGSPLVTYGPYYNYVPAYEVRVFGNDGSGAFKLDSSLSTGWTHPNVYATWPGGATYLAFADTETYLGPSATTDVALGDLDGDGDPEVVTCSANYRAGLLYFNPSYVDFSSGQSYYTLQKGYQYYSSYYGYYYYRPSVRIHDNVGGGFSEVSFPRLPFGGGSAPAFPGRDLALGDVDADSDLDIVVSWHDPLTTTSYDLFYYWSNGYHSSYSTASTSTFVLVNDGSGFFQDATSTWLPTGTSPEFWQANRMELTDLDGDKDPDLVLLLADSTNTFQGKSDYTTHALRVLRNDGSGTGFTDVTSSALPSVPLSGTSDDNLRGTALTVGDVNGDGVKDILVGTTEALLDSKGNAARRTRLLLGASGLKFTDGTAFLPAASSDTGESTDLRLGDLAGRSDPSLLLFNNFTPETSPGSRLLRVFDWYR